MNKSIAARALLAALILSTSLLVISGCAAPAAPTPGAATGVKSESTAATSRAGQQETDLALPGGLTLEDHQLEAPPSIEPLTFSPLDGGQVEILAHHADLRGNRFPDRMTSIDGNPAISTDWGTGTLVAQALTTHSETQEMTVELRHGDQLIFTAPAGYPSPANPLQGLWTYGSHWAMEILLSTPDAWEGQLYVDGQLLNEQHGYEEVFGSQLIGGKLFYFFRKDGTTGINFDGQDAVLGYDQVPHYGCCSESVLNPQQAEDMVAFFAERGGSWYYVELGLFE